MFPDHSGAIRPRGPVCLVAGDIDCLIGTEASALGQLDIPLHLLCCGAVPRHIDDIKSPEIIVHRLADGPVNEPVPNVHGPCPADASDRVRRALEQLHGRYAFTAIVFAALDGLGFRTLQARDARLGFESVTLAVYLDACSTWLRSQREEWPGGIEDLERDYLERSAFERADLQLVRNAELLKHVRADGWNVTGECRTGSLAGALSACARTLLSPPLRERRLRLSAKPQAAHPSSQPLSRADEGMVTVCVPHHNLGAHLPRTLESLARQTYPHLEVLVIDDGSTCSSSRVVFDEQRERFPQFRFLTQPNAGIGATRNRGLAEASGEYFVPMDADNVARPELVSRLVQGIYPRPDLAALTCCFLAFADDADLQRGRYRYAYRPVGGPRVLACLRNVYGDATAIYRTAAFRSVGGWETDRDSSFEDWEAFVKLAQAGFGIDVLPEYLFYYRHREEGFSRVTRQYANHERVLRRFRQEERLPVAERIALWNALFGFHRQIDSLSARSRGFRHRFADGVHAACQRIPFAVPTLKWLLRPFASGTRAHRPDGPP